MSPKLVEMAANGRLVIPHETRAPLGLTQASEQLSVEIRDGSIVLTPVVAVPVDRNFPLTPQLIESAARAAAESGPGLSRGELMKRLGRPAKRA